jgi:hypothetical protein
MMFAILVSSEKARCRPLAPSMPVAVARRTAALTNGASPGLDFSRVAVFSPKARHGKSAVRVSRPTDTGEVDATQTADQVMRTRTGTHSVAPMSPMTVGEPGRPLPSDVRAFMEPRLEMDFSHVRVHTDDDAQRFNRLIHARATTVGHHIYYGLGHAPALDSLTAHELAHVKQNVQSSPEHEAVAQRMIELRPPGRGEASAFDRRQELVDRLNAVSDAVVYRLGDDSRTVLYDIVEGGELSTFDQQVTGFIDAGQVIPLRLITHEGRVGSAAAGFEPLLEDEFVLGYVDLDDLLAGDDSSFKLVFSHLVTERLDVPNYARRIGTNIGGQFARAHGRGRAAETALLRGLLNDPSIEYNYDEVKPNGTLVVAWRSRDHRYSVFHILRDRPGREVVGGVTQVRTADGRRLSLEDFIAERSAAVPAAP